MIKVIYPGSGSWCFYPSRISSNQKRYYRSLHLWQHFLRLDYATTVQDQLTFSLRNILSFLLREIFPISDPGFASKKVSILTQKLFLSSRNMIWVVHPRSGSWFFNQSGSRIQGSKRHRMPDPDPQHWRDIPGGSEGGEGADNAPISWQSKTYLVDLKEVKEQTMPQSADRARRTWWIWRRWRRRQCPNQLTEQDVPGGSEGGEGADNAEGNQLTEQDVPGGSEGGEGADNAPISWHIKAYLVDLKEVKEQTMPQSADGAWLTWWIWRRWRSRQCHNQLMARVSPGGFEGSEGADNATISWWRVTHLVDLKEVKEQTMPQSADGAWLTWWIWRCNAVSVKENTKRTVRVLKLW